MNQRKEIIWRMFLSKTGVEIGGLLRSAQPQVLHCASTPDSIPRYLGSFGYSNREQEIGVCELASLSFPCPLSYVPMDREPCNLVISYLTLILLENYTLIVWQYGLADCAQVSIDVPEQHGQAGFPRVTLM